METSRSCIAWSSAAWVLGGGAVDLVGQQEVGEDRAGEELQLAAAGLGVLLDDVDARDVGGHQVGGELDPAELHVERPRQRARHQSLADPGHPQEQDVPAAEQADEQVVDHRLLADDHLGHLLADAEPRVAEPGDDRGVVVGEVFGGGRVGGSRVWHRSRAFRSKGCGVAQRSGIGWT
jgi:hypothetical protein